jgi:hypothetical protein
VTDGRTHALTDGQCGALLSQGLFLGRQKGFRCIQGRRWGFPRATGRFLGYHSLGLQSRRKVRVFFAPLRRFSDPGLKTLFTITIVMLQRKSSPAGF